MTVKKFNFRDNDKLTLEIQGHQFDVLVSELEVYEGAMELIEQMENLPSLDNAEVIRGMMLSVTNFVDKILGDNAAAKIFEGRSVSIIDLIDLLTFLTQAVQEDMQTKLSQYSPDRIKG